MKRLAFVSALSMTLTGQAMAAGFQLIEQSVSGMGTAYAGSAAVGQDASTVYFNPAAMTRLKGTKLVAAAHIVVPQAEYRDNGSTAVTTASLGTNTGGDAGVLGVVPNLYLTHQYNEKLYVGLGINAPFGLSTKYDPTWIGRYHAQTSELLTLNINPSVAFKVSDQFSIGAGINAQYIDAHLTNAIDFGTVDAVVGLGQGLTSASLASDGSVDLKGDDWSFGYNLGVLFSLNEATRIGLHYRSEIEHDLSGNADFFVPAPAAAIPGLLGGRFTDTAVASSVELPATISLSLYHQLTPKWAVLADISQTNWSSIPELRFNFANPAEPDGVTTLNWKDSNRYSIGATYAHTDHLTYRFGVALDETPIPSASLRTPRVPGEDRIWLAFGAGYQKSDKLSFEFGYAHLFVDDPIVNKTAVGEDLFRGNISGSYDSSVDIVSAQLNYKFY